MSLSKSLFESQLGIMKRILKLGEFKFGKDTEQFKFFKEEVMNAVYDGNRKLYVQMSDQFDRCDCGANMRHGWSECPKCAGSGYCDKE